nr:MAG TPA: hypothetical protein [Caudoviricetes sp.]
MGLSRYPPFGISFLTEKQKKRGAKSDFISLFFYWLKRRKICK